MADWPHSRLAMSATRNFRRPSSSEFKTSSVAFSLFTTLVWRAPLFKETTSVSKSWAMRALGGDHGFEQILTGLPCADAVQRRANFTALAAFAKISTTMKRPFSSTENAMGCVSNGSATNSSTVSPGAS